MTNPSLNNVLLLEDDLALGTITCKNLKNRSYNPYLAQTIEDATQLCEKITFHLAILDLKLERDTSLSFIPYLKTKFPAVKILMLTGFASIATTVEAIKLGASNYLPKPASINDILIALEEIDQPQPTLEIISSRRLEWEHIQRVLTRNDGNISAAARELNMHRRTLQRKLQKKPQLT